MCEDLACRCNGSQELIAQLEERVGAGGRARRRRLGHLAPQPLPRPVRPRAGRAAHASPASTRSEHVLAPVDAGDGAGGARRPRGRRHRTRSRRSRSPATRVAAAARARRPRRPDEPRRLPRARAATRRCAARSSSGREGVHPRAQGLEADGPRRRRLPDRRQVGGGRAPARPAALPDLQRRRVRARHVQGPRRDRGRSVLADRGDDDRRLRDRLRARLRLPARRVPARARDPRRGARRGAAARLPRRTTSSARASRSTSRSARARRLHLRRGDGDLQLDRGLPRRAAQQAAVPGRRRPVRQADRRQQRRDARERAPDRVLGGGPRLRRDGTEGSSRDEALLPLRATSSARASTRCRSARRCASCSSWPAASRAGASCRRCCSGGAAGGFVRPDELDLPLTFEGAREREDDARLGRRAGARRHASTCRASCMRIAAFFRNESCGQCVPCRVGTVRQQEALARLVSGRTRGGVGRRARADRRDRPVHARRVDLRPRPDGVERDRVGDRPARRLRRSRT